MSYYCASIKKMSNAKRLLKRYVLLSMECVLCEAMKFWCYFVLQLSSMCLSKAGYCAVLGQQSRFMLALKEWNLDLDSKFYITWPQSSLISFLLTGLCRCKVCE